MRRGKKSVVCVAQRGSIKFTYEMESDGKLPFLDLLIIRKDIGAVNLQIHSEP